MIDYEKVSMAVILRDITTPKYINKKHEMLVDIADTLYNADISPEYLKPEYKQLYEEQGAEFWDKVMQDISAIDSQLQGHENELVEDYNTIIKETTI